MRRFKIILALMAALTLAGIVSPAQAEEAPLIQTAEGVNSTSSDCVPGAPLLGERLTVTQTDGVYSEDANGDDKNMVHYRTVVDPGETKQFTIANRSYVSADPDRLDAYLLARGNFVSLTREVEGPNGEIKCEVIWGRGINSSLFRIHRSVVQTPVLEAGEYWLAISEMDRGPGGGDAFAIVAH